MTQPSGISRPQTDETSPATEEGFWAKCLRAQRARRDFRALSRRLGWGMALCCAFLALGMSGLVAMREREVVEMPPLSEWPEEVRAAAEAVRAAPGARKEEDFRTLAAYLGDGSRRKTLRRWECRLPSHPVPGPRRVREILGGPNLSSRSRTGGHDGYVSDWDAGWAWHDTVLRGEDAGDGPETRQLRFEYDHGLLIDVAVCGTVLGY